MPAKAIIPEFDQEMATTRRVIERFPAHKSEWKPHPKSFPIGHLTQLVSMIPGWIATTLLKDKIDLAGSPGYSFETIESLLREFDHNVKAAHKAIASVSEADLKGPWSLTHGEKVILTMPRDVAIRQHLDHLIHHRGQLTVYYRLLDVPVPSIYGPTADEPWQG